MTSSVVLYLNVRIAREKRVDLERIRVGLNDPIADVVRRAIDVLLESHEKVESWSPEVFTEDCVTLYVRVSRSHQTQLAQLRKRYGITQRGLVEKAIDLISKDETTKTLIRTRIGK